MGFAALYPSYATGIDDLEADMQATKLLLTTDNAGRIQEIPPLPPNARLEAIFLVIEQRESPSAKRKPSPRIAGLGEIHDNLIAPVAAANEWEAES